MFSEQKIWTCVKWVGGVILAKPVLPVELGWGVSAVLESWTGKERIKLLQAELSRAHKPLCLTTDQKPGLRKLLGAELELQRAGKV